MLNPIWKINGALKFDSISEFQPEVYEKLSVYIENHDMPHLIFNGINGSGKTTSALLFSNAIIKNPAPNLKLIYADDPITDEEKKQNMKDSRISSSSVSSMAGKYAKKMAFISQRVSPFVESEPYGEDPYKILIVKNFDALEREQHAFRRIMERYSNTCRMIFITSHLSKIIDPILSRCQIVGFEMISSSVFDRELKKAISARCEDFDESVISELRAQTKNDLGRSIDICQMAYTQSNFQHIHIDNVRALLLNPFDDAVDRVMQSLMGGMDRVALKAAESLLKSYYFDWSEFIRSACHSVIKISDKKLRESFLKKMAEIDGSTFEYRDIRPHIHNLIYQLNKVMYNE